MLKMFLQSLKNLVAEPETIKYPFEPSPEPAGYRGVIHYNEELCIFCDKCENICPPGAIKFVVVDYETGKKEYNYNPYLCIYCGACVRECPKAEEGCLVQKEVRTPPLGRQVPKGKELGYFINRIEDPKEVEPKWREIEELSEKSRAEWAEYKKKKRAMKRAQRQAAKPAGAQPVGAQPAGAAAGAKSASPAAQQQTSQPAQQPQQPKAEPQQTSQPESKPAAGESGPVGKEQEPQPQSNGGNQTPSAGGVEGQSTSNSENPQPTQTQPTNT